MVKKETKEGGGRNEKRVSKTFSHVMKKNDGEEKKKGERSRRSNRKTGREGEKKKIKKK